MVLRARVEREEVDREEQGAPRESFEDFVQRRREQRLQRQQRTYLGAVIALALVCVALAVSNVVLALRLPGLRASVAAVQVTPADEAPAARATPASPAAPPVTAAPPTDEAAPTAAARPPAAPTANAPAPSTPSTAPDLPASSAAAPARPGVAATVPTAPGTTESPSGRTAAWLVQTYGKQEARERARAAAAFYRADGVEAAHWRDVLAIIDR